MADTSLHDMAKTPKEKAESEYPMAICPRDDDYPYGLSICVTHDELAKLDLDDECEVGDMVSFCAIARVTSVSKSESETSGKTCRIELQITHMGVDDVESSDEPDDPGDDEEGYR